MRCLTLHLKGKLNLHSNSVYQSVMFRAIVESYCDVIYHFVVIIFPKPAMFTVKIFV